MCNVSAMRQNTLVLLSNQEFHSPKSTFFVFAGKSGSDKDLEIQGSSKQRDLLRG
jgi:hypothetical protein